MGIDYVKDTKLGVENTGARQAYLGAKKYERKLQDTMKIQTGDKI